MTAKKESDTPSGKALTTVERASEREIVVTRIFNAPQPIVFKAWTTLDLFKRWWAPKSFGVTIISATADFRTGGSYRFVMGHPTSDHPMTFFGRYVEVTPPSRLVWTNEESGEGGAVTTVSFEARGDQTLVVMRDLYPSKEALDEAIASGATSGSAEQFAQLDELLAMPGAGERGS